MESEDSMSDVVISVIIAAFNAEKYISPAISSVLAQTFTEIEVIVVDDGSTDATSDIVGGFTDTRVKLLRQENRGQSAASNRGAAAARGKYLKFLDADDVLNRTHLSDQYQAIQGFPGFLASCGWGYFREVPETVTARDESVRKNYSNGLEWLVDCMTLDEGMLGAWLWLIPRELWDRCGGFTESLSLNNDVDLSVRLVLGSKGVRFAEGATYCYRKGVSDSISCILSRKALTSVLHAAQLATRSLLSVEDSPRVRRMCADRFRRWLFHFYPQHSDLVAIAEEEIRKLGGSDLLPVGGRLHKVLVSLLGWKVVRHLQTIAERLGWRQVQVWKQRQRLQRFN
jgi:glycosyltransferase involved in cell wall biosynthesis